MPITLTDEMVGDIIWYIAGFEGETPLKHAAMIIKINAPSEAQVCIFPPQDEPWYGTPYATTCMVFGPGEAFTGAAMLKE